MNREDIIRMAHEAGCLSISPEHRGMELAELERFAALVAAAKCEQCAQISEDFDKEHPETNYGKCIAVNIRDRGNGGGNER